MGNCYNLEFNEKGSDLENYVKNSDNENSSQTK